jgi:hypothetical protein
VTYLIPEFPVNHGVGRSHTVGSQASAGQDDCFGWQTCRSKPLASSVNSAGHGWRNG